MTDPDPKLPLESHAGTGTDRARRARALHLSWANIGLVATGGAVGTALRYLVNESVPVWAGVPIATFAVNVTGAFLLGVLLELLADHSHDIGWSRRLRLGVGTGGLGGFTTYSALAVETATLAAAHPGRAIGYALATLLIGAMASIAGIWLSRGHLRPAILNSRKEP